VDILCSISRFHHDYSIERDEHAYSRTAGNEALGHESSEVVYDLGFSCEERHVSDRTKSSCRVIYLLLLPEGKKTHTGYLHHLESHTRNITLGLATTTETRNQDFIVLVDEVQATIVLHSGQLEVPKAGVMTTTYGHEGSDLFAVLDQLNTNAFPDGRVGLLGLDPDLLQNDPLRM